VAATNLNVTVEVTLKPDFATRDWLLSLGWAPPSSELKAAPVDLAVNTDGPLDRVISLRLSNGHAQRLRAVADQLDVDYTVLARRWIVQCLEEFERTH
jgi:hypothetical protein